MVMLLNTQTLHLLAVNVGTPAPLFDTRTGRTTLSGIVKHTVDDATVTVDFVNIAGDRQADLVHHGGQDKAVYCYAHEHLPCWQGEIGYPPPGKEAPFGENLSVTGATEDDIHIGDRWQWGDVVLEVAQPRWPCFKLGLHAGLPDLPVQLIECERSGWYCRVVTEGEAPASNGDIRLMRRDDNAPTVREAFRAAKGRVDRDHATRIAHHPALAAAWRSNIARRYRKTDGES